MVLTFENVHLATRPHPARIGEGGKGGAYGVRYLETGKVLVDFVADVLLLVLPSGYVLLK